MLSQPLGSRFSMLLELQKNVFAVVYGVAIIAAAHMASIQAIPFARSKNDDNVKGISPR